MASATGDPARELTLYFRINRDASITLYFVDSGDNAFLLADYTFVLNFKIRKNESSNVLQLTSGSGLTKNASTLVIALTKAQAAAFREQAYFWELIVTDDDDQEKDWLTGDAIFHEGKFDGVVGEDTVSIIP